MELESAKNTNGQEESTCIGSSAIATGNMRAELSSLLSKTVAINVVNVVVVSLRLIGGVAQWLERRSLTGEL